MSVKQMVFLILVLLFSYQNCSNKNHTQESSQQSQSRQSSESIENTEDEESESVVLDNLSDQQVQQVKFDVEQDSEVQNGSQTFLVKTKKNYVLDPESGVLAEHDQASGELSTYCLSHDLLLEIRSIISSSKVCRGGTSHKKDTVCAQVLSEPYAEIVTMNDVIQLGSASDACGSNKVDLCGDHGNMLKKWIKSVSKKLPQLTCGQ